MREGEFELESTQYLGFVLFQLDPKETNEIGALDAAKFLKRSGLSDVVLSRIWDLSDPGGKGFLTKEGFFVALKLIGLAQEGLEFATKNIYNELSKPPKVVSDLHEPDHHPRTSR